MASGLPAIWMRADRSSTVNVPANQRTLPYLALQGLWAALLVIFSNGAPTALRAGEPPKADRHFQYTNDIIDSVPWSIHLVKIERSFTDFEFCTTLGKAETFGMSTVSEQLKPLIQEGKLPLAAINGDFYQNSQKYQGR